MKVGGFGASKPKPDHSESDLEPTTKTKALKTFAFNGPTPSAATPHLNPKTRFKHQTRNLETAPGPLRDKNTTTTEDHWPSA